MSHHFFPPSRETEVEGKTREGKRLGQGPQHGGDDSLGQDSPSWSPRLPQTFLLSRAVVNGGESFRLSGNQTQSNIIITESEASGAQRKQKQRMAATTQPEVQPRSVSSWVCPTGRSPVPCALMGRPGVAPQGGEGHSSQGPSYPNEPLLSSEALSPPYRRKN